MVMNDGVVSARHQERTRDTVLLLLPFGVIDHISVKRCPRSIGIVSLGGGVVIIGPPTLSSAIVSCHCSPRPRILTFVNAESPPLLEPLASD